MPDLGYEQKKNKIKIAIMDLAFNNGDILGLLKERGAAIVNQDWEKRQKLERKMIEIKDDQKKFKRLTNPCHVFMTF